MSLAGLLPILYSQPGYRELAEAVAGGERAWAEAPLDAARPYLLAALHADVTGPRNRTMIVVSPRSERARLLYEGLLAYSPPGTPIHFFPAPDLLPYERIAPDPTILGERLTVLAHLAASRQSAVGSRQLPIPNTQHPTPNTRHPSPATSIIVTSVFALLQPTMAPADLTYAMRVLRRGERVQMRELLGHLLDLGYTSSPSVEGPGQFSRRGGIIDLFPPTSSLPVRVEFFGDEIDSIRLFNPLTQRSEGQAEALIVTPACEMPLWRREEAASKLREISTDNLREEVLEEWNNQLEKTAAGECFEGMELFSPYHTQPLASLADYLAIGRETKDEEPALSLSKGRKTDGDESGDELDELQNESKDDSFVPSTSSGQALRPFDKLRAGSSSLRQAQGRLSVQHERPLLVLDDPHLINLEAEEIERQASELYRGFVDNGELPPGLRRPYLTWEEVSAHGRGMPILSVGGGVEGGIEPPPFASPRLYTGNVANVIEDLKGSIKAKSRIVVVSQQASRLRELLEDEDIYPTIRKGMGATKDEEPALSLPKGRRTAALVTRHSALVIPHSALHIQHSSVQDALLSVPQPGSVNLLQGALAAGWRLAGREGSDTLVLTDAEIFGRSHAAPRRMGTQARRSTSDAAAILREKMLLELKPDDYVVHVEHGIAKFGGLVHMNTNGNEREYMLLLYAEGDRLYVPADQTDRVAPYIGTGPPPHLHRLGTAEWSRTKKRVREATQLLAKELLQLYAAREMAPGHAYPSDTPWQYELEESFPYMETPDQLRAIGEVKEDMEQPRPMDRLICGDVGYGKTEVALRAAFKAVMDGRQVAVLVPTTVLAQQHFNTFSERLAAFPVKVSMLSRFRSRQEQVRIIKELGEGKIDIMVGTHMLLSKNVLFRNLGLVIVDEEQRFGVRHKERLKHLRAEVDVITLSATPIPRTLYMAISGVRDLSLIETPPEARLPIKTYVTAYRTPLVREVILRELERGGQVFFVHNRVETIEKLHFELAALVPEARFIVGHGQMPEDHLEKVMSTFVAGEADVLLCTTIIESGLDIPNANTLIVDHADKLGLAQLYQLRGRVGRGAVRAYAYFLYHQGRKVTETARERLSTIEQNTELGAGFKIALKDLEIRGAGNLLGPEQSGQVSSVGLDLYTRLLATAVDKARAEGRRTKDEGRRATEEGQQTADGATQHSALSTQHSSEEPPVVSLDLPITAYLPEDYVPDAAVRLRLYQRMAASMTPAQIRDMTKELEDRFGSLPEPAASLVEVVRLKSLALTAGVESIRALDTELVVQTPEETILPESLRMRLQRKYRDVVKVSPHQVRIHRARAGIGWKDILSAVLEEMGEYSVSA